MVGNINIIKEYILQKDEKDEVFYNLNKRPYKKFCREYIDENGDECCSVENIYDESDENIIAKEINTDEIIELKKNNKNIVILHVDEYNKLLNDIQTMDIKIHSQNKTIESLNIKINNLINQKNEENENVSKLNVYVNSPLAENGNLNINNNLDGNIKFDDSVSSNKFMFNELINETHNGINDIYERLQNMNENISKNIIDLINIKDLNNKRVANSILNRIKKYYNNYKINNFLIKYDETPLDDFKYKIYQNYENIYINKAKIIYNYYELYKEYLIEKEKDSKLIFIQFVEYNTSDIASYNEKARISYEFFDCLLTTANEMELSDTSLKYKNIYIIIDVLKMCKISIDKLYNLRKEKYNEMVEFLKPIIKEKCK